MNFDAVAASVPLPTVTRVSKRSSTALRAVPAVAEVPEPELAPLEPAEPTINRTCYELFLERLLADAFRHAA